MARLRIDWTRVVIPAGTTIVEIGGRGLSVLLDRPLSAPVPRWMLTERHVYVEFHWQGSDWLAARRRVTETEED